MPAALALAAVLLSVTPEGAETNLVAPRLGVAGGLGGPRLTDGLVRVDLSVGGEWRRPSGASLGFDAQLAWLGTGSQLVAWAWSSVHLGGNLVWASRFADEQPFASVSTGPFFAGSWRGAENLTRFGGGWQLEGALGFKSLAELFCAASLSVDRVGLLPAVVLGARLNLLLLMKLLVVIEQLFSPRHLLREVPDGSYK